MDTPWTGRTVSQRNLYGTLLELISEIGRAESVCPLNWAFSVHTGITKFFISGWNSSKPPSSGSKKCSISAIWNSRVLISPFPVEISFRNECPTWPTANGRRLFLKTAFKNIAPPSGNFKYYKEKILKASLSNLKFEKIPWAVSGRKYPTDLPSDPISHWNIRLNSIGRESSFPEVDFIPSSFISSKVSSSFNDSTNFNFSSSSTFFDFEVFLEFNFDSIWLNSVLRNSRI